MKIKKKSRITAVIMAVLMALAMVPMTAGPAFAEGNDIPFITVILKPGTDSDETITVTSHDEGIVDPGYYPGTGHFAVHENDPSLLWYRVPEKPDSFSGVSGASFMGWVGEDSNYYYENDMDYYLSDGDVLTLIATWSKNKVTFNSNGGSDVDSQIVDFGETVEKPGDPERPEWDFKYWYVGNDRENEYDFDKPCVRWMELNALWCVDRVATVYDRAHQLSGNESDCGTIDIKTSLPYYDWQDVKIVYPTIPEGPVNLTAKPAKGYCFEGWYECRTDGGSYYPTDKLYSSNAKYTIEAGTDISDLCAVFRTAKNDNPLKVKGLKAKVKYKKLKKGPQYLAVTKVIETITPGKGTMSYKLTSAKKKSKSFKKYFKMNTKTGKVTVKKGLKKGTYTIKADVKAAGNVNYKAKTQKVTFTVKVK